MTETYFLEIASCVVFMFRIVLLLMLGLSLHTQEQEALDVHERADKRCTKNSVTKVHANEFLIY